MFLSIVFYNRVFIKRSGLEFQVVRDAGAGSGVGRGVRLLSGCGQEIQLLSADA